MLLGLMHVMRNRPQVVEKLAEHVPSAALAHHLRPQEFVSSGFDGFLQQPPLAAAEVDIAQPLVGRRSRTVGGVGGGREPALINSAAMRTQRIQIARIELKPPPRHEERAWHPAWRKSHNALARRESFLEKGGIRHNCVGQADSLPSYLFAEICSFGLTLSRIGSPANEFCCPPARVSTLPET